MSTFQYSQTPLMQCTTLFQGTFKFLRKLVISLVRKCSCIALCYKTERLMRVVNLKRQIYFTFQVLYTNKISSHIGNLLFTEATTGYANEKIYTGSTFTSTACQIIVDLLKFKLIS
jgi:hypothetical protein